MNRPVRSTWQQHQHMRAIDPAPYRYTKPTRTPRLTLARVATYATVMIAWALIALILFTAATNGAAA